MFGSQLAARSHGTGQWGASTPAVASRATLLRLPLFSLEPAQCHLIPPSFPRVDQDENDDHIFAIIKYFCASSVQYPQIAVDLGRHFGAFLLSTAKVRAGRQAFDHVPPYRPMRTCFLSFLQAFQRRRRLATLTKAVAAYALESVKALEERSPMGLEATAEKEGMAVFFAIGRLGAYCKPLYTLLLRLDT